MYDPSDIIGQLGREHGMRAKYYGRIRKRTLGRKIYKAVCKKEYFLTAAAIAIGVAATITGLNVHNQISGIGKIQNIEQIVSRP
jgi:hypothetical protein